MTKIEKVPSGNPGKGPAETKHPTGVSSPADETGRMRSPDTGELSDRALEDVSGGARISKTDLLKLQ